MELSNPQANLEPLIANGLKLMSKSEPDSKAAIVSQEPLPKSNSSVPLTGTNFESESNLRLDMTTERLNFLFSKDKSKPLLSTGDLISEPQAVNQ